MKDKEKTYTFNQFKKRCPMMLDNLFGEKSKENRAEDRELIDFIAWFKLKYPHHENAIAHPVNEVKGDHGGYGKTCKQKGKLGGIHDVILFLPAGFYHFATFELKRSDHKGTVKENQIVIAETNLKNGGYSCIVWGLAQLKIAAINYMNMRDE